MKALLISIMLMTCTTAIAKNGNEKGSRKERMKKMAKELNLSEEQVDKIKEIRKKYKSELKNGREQKQKLKEELTAMMDSTEKGDSFNSKAKAKQQELQSVNNQLHSKQFDMRLEIRNVLEPSQIKDFNKMKTKKRGKFKERLKSKFKEKN